MTLYATPIAVDKTVRVRAEDGDRIAQRVSTEDGEAKG